ncbi:hypothetical protein [Leptospira kirschneri]|uniref:Uncharacterized protein n=1 Tax=Leptospira kirschneri str. H1 TaxID=1049966 RepID=A0A0E2B8N9_9LEPT|nr:hypothetical protein [Leptospira kirschneri]EJO69276.1 hypothetical protein LEP1GSC044_3213 [Leptospira kirschneri serovar Grippotyphosa str. RM52]EKO17565.1 hypothetical protein LEP1GSC081_0371 [Leptospira kirschneri str. H1]EKO62013.1 hypothetical protein LEP1GSC082_0431 [Leptospira kirschneri str. H2]EKR08920.1 hypothetical protein LEP1GSC122_0637 [Leptospira kirschneri serovar Valbuzzi str. 200702274]OOV49719.1 hypothetical protein B1J94_04495 [Leptospira kirschneri serovar Grippotyphos
MEFLYSLVLVAILFLLDNHFVSFLKNIRIVFKKSLLNSKRMILNFCMKSAFCDLHLIKNSIYKFLLEFC